MPAQPAAHRMVAGVEAIAAERGEVDAADERDLAVDDHQLLVVAMHRPLVRVERASHARAADQLVAHARARPPRAGVKTGTGAPAHSSTLTSTRSARSPSRSRSRDARSSRVRPNIGREVPPGDVHMRASAGERLGDAAAAPGHRQPAPRARPPSAAADRPQPTTMGRQEDRADRSGRPASAGDDDVYRSRARSHRPPSHRRAQRNRLPMRIEPTRALGGRISEVGGSTLVSPWLRA